MNDYETDEDLYGNPDFDDFIPNEEYNEEFINQLEEGPELYDGEYAFIEEFILTEQFLHRAFLRLQFVGTYMGYV